MKTKVKTDKLVPHVESPTWGDVQRMAQNVLDKFKELVPDRRASFGTLAGGAADVLNGQSFYTLAFLSSLMVDGKLNEAKLIPDKAPKKPSKERALRMALVDLLDMLTEWDGGFDGFHAVNQAERLLGRPVSEQPQPKGLLQRIQTRKKHSRSGQVQCVLCAPLRCKQARK